MEDSDTICHRLLSLPDKYKTVLTATEIMTLEFVKCTLDTKFCEMKRKTQ